MFVCTNRRSFLVGMAAATAVSGARAAGPSAAERMNAANKHLARDRGARGRPPRRPERAPIIAAVYYTKSSAPMDARNAIHKEVGALIADTF